MATSRRRRRTVVVTGGAAVALVGALAVSGLPGGRAKADAGGPKLGSAEVTRRTLVEQQDFDATLGHGDATPVVNRRNGTLTWLAPAGSTVDRGQPLYEVDGRKVPLLFGDRPAWRPLGPDVKGTDVRQLEDNLVALGYANARTLDVDDTWTAATTDAVKRWQKA
ncbi:MAG TPA: peptidoglycan-binding domain-containing protein, partial [Acidimicrobiia bacterium]